MLNVKFFLVILAFIGVLALSCTTDGLCKSDADCCEHYICKSWSPEGYHCMTGCQPPFGPCKEPIDCCATGSVCRNSICVTGHELGKKVDENSTVVN